MPIQGDDIASTSGSRVRGRGRARSTGRTPPQKLPGRALPRKGRSQPRSATPAVQRRRRPLPEATSVPPGAAHPATAPDQGPRPPRLRPRAQRPTAPAGASPRGGPAQASRRPPREPAPARSLRVEEARSRRPNPDVRFWPEAAPVAVQRWPVPVGVLPRSPGVPCHSACTLCLRRLRRVRPANGGSGRKRRPWPQDTKPLRVARDHAGARTQERGSSSKNTS